MIEQDKAIFIEYCNNCSSHAWCTKHDESRYHSFFNSLKQDLEKQFKGFTIYGNTNPLTGKPIIPSLGAFEVFYMKRRVFSKVKSSIWPMNNVISARIKSIIEGKTPAGCELVDYTYDDAPAVEKKRRTINLPKQHKRTFDCQNGSRNESYACTLTNLPTENQPYPGLPNKDRPHSWIDMESKIRKRVATTINVDKDNLKKFSQTMFKNRLVTPKSDKKVNPKINNENYYLPTKNRAGNSAVKARDPTSLNEMSLTLQTMTDFTNVYPTYVDSIIKEEEFNPKKKNNQRQLSVTTSTRAGSTYSKLEPLDKTGIASLGLDSKTDVSFQRKQIRSLSQDMGTGQDIADKELNTSTVFSQILKEPASVKNQEPRAKKVKKELQWFPDGLSDRSSPDRFEERILNDKKQKAENNGDEENNEEEYEIDPVLPNSGKNTVQKEEDTFLTKLKKLRFPEEKLSQLRVSKKATTKKKITLTPDENSDCRIEVYSTHPQILSLPSNQFLVMKGEPFKIPLKFEYQEIKFLDNFCLYILKNNRAWQKIMLDLTFL